MDLDETRVGTSLEELYRSSWARLVRVAWLMTGSREAGEDIVQDAFVALERTWPTVEYPNAYLYQSVVNLVRGRARRDLVASRHAPSNPSPIFNPEIDETWELLGRLPPRQRHAIVLRYYEDLTVDEIARLLDCAPGTAKSLIHRGLGRLSRIVT